MSAATWPGNYNPTASDIMQEGVRIPPVKFADRGVDQPGHRGHPARQRAAAREQLRRPQRPARARSTSARRGCTTCSTASATTPWLRRWRRFRIARAGRCATLISELPDGTYSFEDHIDNDGRGDDPLKVALDLTIDGETLTLDFSRSAPACAGPLNVSRATTIAASFVALKHIFHEVPTSGGCLEPIEFVIPEGSILAAEPPAPVSGYTENIMRTIDVIFGALARAAPERANAACFATVNALLMSGQSR